MPFRLARVTKASSKLHGQWASIWIRTSASLLLLGQPRRLLHSLPISPHSCWRMRMATAVCITFLIGWGLPLAPLTWWLGIPCSGCTQTSSLSMHFASLENAKIAAACFGPARGIAASSTACFATLQRRSGQLCCNLVLTSGLVLAASTARTWIHLSGFKLPLVLATQGCACVKQQITRLHLCSPSPTWSRPWRPSMRKWREVSHLLPGLCSGRSKSFSYLGLLCGVGRALCTQSSVLVRAPFWQLSRM